MAPARWGRDTTFATWLARYLLAVFVAAFILGVVVTDSTREDPPVETHTRVIERRVITAAELEILRQIAEGLSAASAGPLTPEQQDAVDTAEGVVEDVRDGQIIVVPPNDEPTPTTGPPATSPPATDPPRLPPVVHDLIPPEVTVP